MARTSPRPLLRFTLAGIPVDVQPAFALLLGVSAFQYRDATGGAIWLGVVTLSVLWHEMGHALAMRAFGYPPRVELVAMGGLAHWPPGASPRAREALIVTAAGPGAGLALGAVVWLLDRVIAPPSFAARIAVSDLLFVNVAWSLFNLLPMLPLDGGNLLDHVSRLLRGASRPRWVGWASVVTGGGVVLLAIARQTPYVGLLGMLGATAGLSRIRGVALGEVGRAADEGAGRAPEGRSAAQRARPRGANGRAATALLSVARTGLLAEPELAELVGLLVELRRGDELVALCRERFTAFARRSDAEALARLAGEALTDAGECAQALEVAQCAFRQLRIPYHGYDAACHLVRLERHEEAVQWLEQALEAGLEGGSALLTDPMLGPLRDRADFQALLVNARGRSRMA